MDVYFSLVWYAIGCDGFVPVEENGSSLLTIQFLCTLRKVDVFVFGFLGLNIVLLGRFKSPPWF